MLHKKCNKDQTASTPPDVDNPPLHIPLKSLEERYQVVEELGNGSFGSVALAKAQFDVTTIQNDGGKQHLIRDTLMNQAGSEHDNYNGKQQGIVAIKTMMTKLPALHDYTRVREVKFILSIPANKHLIQIFEMFVDTRAYQLHIVMECMEQNLYQMMRHRRRRVFSIPSLKSILAQILAGIRHIHEQDFFHRDVKPENILISPSTRYFDNEWLSQGHYTDNYVVKLADFGLARHTSNKNPYTAYVSTRWYRSPEILLRSGYYSKPLDVWAFGCVAVEVTIFKPLFPGSNEMDQIWKILEVLGTPHNTKESERTGYESHGGNWEDAKHLAQRLNMKFPYVEGTGLNNLISSSQLQPLTDVIKSCLKWDPNQRVTAQELCMMPFFQGTIAARECLEASDRKAAIERAAVAAATRVARHYTVDSNGGSSNNSGVCGSSESSKHGKRTDTEQASIFAGIKSHARAGSMLADKSGYHTRQLIFHSEGFMTVKQQKQRELLPGQNDDDIIINEQVHEVEDECADDDEISPFRNPLGDYLTDDVAANTPDELVDSDSTISDDDENQDEMDLSHEIAQNIAFCEIPAASQQPFEDSQFVPEGNDYSEGSCHQTGSSVKKFPADKIEAFNRQDPDLYSQYYSTNTMPTAMTTHVTGKSHSHTPFAETLNYVHYAPTHQATSPSSSTGDDTSITHEASTNNNDSKKHQTHSSLQPVNRLLDNMSIDDSFNNNNANNNNNNNNNSNSNSDNINLIPRSFMLPPNGFDDPIQRQPQPQQQQQHFNHHFGNVTF